MNRLVISQFSLTWVVPDARQINRFLSLSPCRLCQFTDPILMVAALQSSYPSPKPPRRPRSQRSRSRVPVSRVRVAATVVALPSPSGSAAVATAPKVSSLTSALQFPWWLRLALATQQGSSVLVMIVGLLTLSCYASVVYAEHRWGQTYETLERLRRQELQLTATHEALKQNLAASAGITANKNGLPLRSPESMVFLEPTDPRPAMQSTESAPKPHTPFPLGY